MGTQRLSRETVEKLVTFYGVSQKLRLKTPSESQKLRPKTHSESQLVRRSQIVQSVMYSHDAVISSYIIPAIHSWF